MFRPVGSRVDFPAVETKILNFWKESKIFERSVEARQGGPRFVLFEGPPTANGSPGIHHVLSRVFKDIIPRYKTMKGYYCPRRAGWDTHGLPVELEVERKLGLTSKPQIEQYGVAKFNAICRESVLGYLRDWEALTERIGYWVDLRDAYVTMDNSYIESCWWAIKQLWEKDLVYQGYRVTPHCPRCGTSLSSHEVALGYRDDAEDPSVYVKFRVISDRIEGLARNIMKSAGRRPVYFMAWTTTPWTLPGNMALAVAADAEYSMVQTGNEYLIMATVRLEGSGLGEAPVLIHFKGKDLVGMTYEPLYRVPVLKSDEELPPYRVIAGEYVSMEEGTGIVHIAPAYGEIDFEVGEKEGLPLVHTVDLEGRVRVAVPYGLTPQMRGKISEGAVTIPAPEKLGLPGAGKFVKKADKDILADLENRGLLFRAETIKHTYPFCWRCATPLLYYAKQTWYIRTTAKKPELMANNEQINWYPEHIKRGRFGDWLENNVDWAFSRERYWGTPLPVWRCIGCGGCECIGSVAELKEKPGFSGLKAPLDLHRPYVDEPTFDCPRCHGKMERVSEVIDCWFDSGAMPIGQWHYPFENSTIFADGRFPADYICEAVDQTRGWFYSLHALSTLLFDQPSFRNVICLGHILDAKGEKMSKARGNVVEPGTVIDKYGVDAVRWYFYTASPPGNVRRFSEKLVGEVRGFLMTLWNVYSFFVTYGNIDRFRPETVPVAPEPAELDRWIMSELNQLIVDVDARLEKYDPTEAGRKIETFVDNLSNWYVRRSRRRFWKSESDTDKLSAYRTLYDCLVTLAKLMAPFTPFVAEEIYQNLVRVAYPDAVPSVHMADFPVADRAMIDRRLTDSTRLAIRVSSMGRAARSQAGIKVRQPLSRIVVKVASPEEKEYLERVRTQVLEELNIKDMAFAETPADLEKSGYTVSSDGDYAIAVDAQVTPELAVEGMAREIVHHLQTVRRNAGFEIADYIKTYYEADEYVSDVMQKFGDYIKQETLSRELVSGIPAEGVTPETARLGGHEMRLAVKKLE